MPNKKSAIKRVRTNKKCQTRNRMTRSMMRTSLRTVIDAAEGGKVAEAEQALPEALSRAGKTCKKGLLHKNNLARKMSRLMRVVNQAKAAAAPAAQ